MVVKHTNPCGLACDDSLVESYRRAHSGDPISAYGGILGFNREVDEETARELSQIFYEAIIAPGYSPEALAVSGGEEESAPADHRHPDWPAVCQDRMRTIPTNWMCGG